MSFGTDLQGKKSHEAYLKLQDAEIRLLDNIKRCLNVRIDSDKKYATSLSSFVQQAQKVEFSEFQSCSSNYRAWEAIVQQTNKFVDILRNNVEELGSKTLEKITNLINDKKAARKQYLDDRNRLELDFTKVQDEVQRQKQEYTKSVERLKVDRAKYNDSQSKGKPAKVEEAKTKFTKSTGKLHRVHNDYVLSLREVVSHENCYLKQTLPTILDYHQTKHELMGDQCKDILQDYLRLTDFSNEDCCDIFKKIGESVTQIVPDTDLTDFISQFRTDPLPTTSLEFDSRLLDDCETSLTQNEIVVDNETVDSLNSRLSTVETELSKVTKSLEDKESSCNETETSVNSLQKYSEEEKQSLNLEYVNKRKQLEDLRREVTELTAKRDTLQVLCETIKTPVEATGDKVPSATDFSGDSVADNSTHSITSGGGGGIGSQLKGLKGKFTAARNKKHNQEKEEKEPQRYPSYEEATVDSTSNGPRIPSTSDGNGLPEASSLPLEEEEWFHGVLPREEVQRLLSSDGDYLVRESKNRKTNETQYVLSVFWQGHRHFIIQYGEGGWRFEGASFPTIAELIHNQHKADTPVTTKSQAYLRNAILREEWQLRNDDIALEMKIGNGNFGEVYRGIYKPRSMTVAVKTCKDTLSEDQRKKFLQEGRILKQYDHPNIVRFIGIAAQRQPVMIVMEYVSGGALLNYLRKHGKTQSKKTLTKMCEDAASGMAYLESKNCIHRDLAARNCLIGENSTVKISDFGMSREEEEYTVSDGLKQIPIKWTAPEALLYGKYTSLCDVWSFGILMWEVFSGGLTPYQGMTNAESREKVDGGYRMPASQDTPEEVYELMLRCWERNPSKRPHFEEIHSKLKSIVPKL